MNNLKLDELVESGDLKSYSFTLHDEDGKKIDRPSGMRQTHRLVLEFPSGKTITIDTSCSGVLENSFMIIE